MKKKKKYKKSNKKKSRSLLIKTIVVLALLIISLGFNIAQIFIYQNNKSVSEDISWRLNNYRKLQETQITAVKQNCEKITNDYNTTLGRYYNVINLYDSVLASAYIANLRLRCRIPALAIAGYTEGSYEENVKKVFDTSTLEINDDVFNNVRW